MQQLSPLALSLGLSLGVAGAAAAQDPPATTTTPATTATTEAPAAPAAPVDPFAEPKQIIENEANTVANLKKAIELYEKILGDTTLDKGARADAYADVSRAYLRWGDLEQKNDAKIALYEKGVAAGKKGEAENAKNANAIFWGTANMACVGRTRGVMNSLFMIGDLRKGMNRVLELNPNFHLARNTLSEIDHAVPGIAGGSDDRAEKGYLEVMRRNPHVTATMVLLAKFYKDKGDEEKAKEWAQKVLDEKKPWSYNDWAKFDKRDAKAVLKDLE